MRAIEDPLFSILIPVYNVEDYISFCIESVIKQSYSKFEIILVDDGSTDKSGMICDEFKKMYTDKIKVIHKENAGSISARRTGLKNVTGDYVCFLDSDDLWEKDLLNELQMVIKNTQSDLIVFDWKKIDENGIDLGEIPERKFNDNGIIDKEIYLKKMLSSTVLNSLCIKCCRYDLLDVDKDYSIYYNLKNGEDLFQSLPIVEKAKRIYYLNKPLYCYRVNMKSITHTYSKGQYHTLNIVRPKLYESMCRMKMETKENIDLFYQMYLGLIWSNLESLYCNYESKKDLRIAIKEIKSYDYVKKAASYIKKCQLDKVKKNGLKIFYRDNYKTLFYYMRLYNVFKSVYRKIRFGRGKNKK